MKIKVPHITNPPDTIQRESFHNNKVITKEIHSKNDQQNFKKWFRNIKETKFS